MSDQSITKQPETLNSLLNQANIKSRFEEILGKRAAAFTSSILSLYNASAQLQRADPRSILQSAVVAATLDLPINQNLGFAFIVPYGEFAQFQLGAKGFIQLAIRTGQYKTIHATEVYRDEVKSWNALTGVFESTPEETWKLRDKNDYRDVVGYMAYFKLSNGFEKQLYMTVEQIQAHGKRYSKSYDNPKAIWKTNPQAMSLKTVIKLLLSKYGLLSIQMEKAIEVDQAVIQGEGEVTFPDRPEEEAVPSKPTGAAKKINDDQFKLLCARASKAGIAMEEVDLYIKTKYSLEHKHDLNIEQLSEVVKWLEQDPEEKP